MNRLWKALVLSVLLLGVSRESKADIIVPGADGSDGPLNCGTLSGFSPDYPCGVPCAGTAPVTYTIDLTKARQLAWNAPQPANTRSFGVYDPDKWAVVFKYSCVDIPANMTLNFKNHPTHAPVVWLVSGDVNIAGNVSLDGSAGSSTDATFAEPGPGGFRGGARHVSNDSPSSAGFGPGGGNQNYYYEQGGSYSTLGGQDSWVFGRYGGVRYGNPGVIPLIGGSGGSPGTNWAPFGGGGGGGGAILIAAARTISLSGSAVAIHANGGPSYGVNARYGGSGGAIRLIANSVQGGGKLEAAGGYVLGGAGRIRIEANSVTLTDPGNPSYPPASPVATAALWPGDLGNAPSVRICRIGGSGETCPSPGQPGYVTTDPRANLDFPGADITIGSGGAQLVVIDAVNVPLDWAVWVQMIPKQGANTFTPAAFGSGDASHSTWTATIPIGSGFSVLQARASSPTAATASTPEEGADDPSSNSEAK